MEYKVNARISNRHVHLTKETYEMLFDEEIMKRNDLNQIGEFASNQTVTIRHGDKVINNVRVLGPFRTYNQIEISKKDARTLGLNPPVRRSGDLKDSLNITLETNKNSIEIKGLIIANRHVHINTLDKDKYDVENGQKVKIKIDGDKSGIIDAEVKISDNGYYELHLDTDDANAFLLEDNDEVTMIV